MVEDDDFATTTADCCQKKKLKNYASKTPRVSFYVFLSRRSTVQKKIQSRTGVGIFPSLADLILDRPEWGKFLLWAVDFS
jgi:hypothetical protein